MFVAPSAYPLGGVAVWLAYLAPALERHGWRACAGLVSGDFHDVDVYQAAYPQLAVVKIDSLTGSQQGRVNAIERALAHHKPDLVVAVNIVDVYAAVQCARKAGQAIKVVMAIHGIAADLLNDMKRQALHLDGVICTNRLVERLCAEYANVPRERIFYAPYGVQTASTPQSGSAGPGEPLQMAWVGRLEQTQKRVDDIPGILRQLDAMGVNYRLKLVGNGPDRERLLAELRPWLEDGRVDYVGEVPAARITELVYASADVLLLTSTWETGPIVVWEAMAAGTAVVTSRYVGSGAEGALRHDVNCLMFPTGDCVAAARQLERLASHPELAHSISAAGKNLVDERYSVERSIAEWARCLAAIHDLPPLAITEGSHAVSPSGRLDTYLGVRLAETVRSALGIRFRHTSPGGEWPHTAGEADEQLLLELAGALDAVP